MAKTFRVGLVGYRFMGRAHSNAWRQAPKFFPLKANVELAYPLRARRCQRSRGARSIGLAAFHDRLARNRRITAH